MCQKQSCGIRVCSLCVMPPLVADFLSGGNPEDPALRGLHGLDLMLVLELKAVSQCGLPVAYFAGNSNLLNVQRSFRTCQ